MIHKTYKNNKVIVLLIFIVNGHVKTVSMICTAVENIIKLRLYQQAQNFRINQRRKIKHKNLLPITNLAIMPFSFSTFFKAAPAKTICSFLNFPDQSNCNSCGQLIRVSLIIAISVH